MTYYLSKGLRAAPARVSRCGQTLTLTGEQETLWLAGQHQPSWADYGSKQQHLQTLEQMGLVETSWETEPLALYRILTRCVICPADVALFRRPLNPRERVVYNWLTRAGMRLTAAELILLYDHGVRPTPGLLGEANRQALTETIYTTETIFDGILEADMEHAPRRDEAVQVILGLLRKRRVFLV